MSQSTSLFSLASVASIAFAAAATIFLSPDLAFAGDKKGNPASQSHSQIKPAPPGLAQTQATPPAASGSCTCPAQNTQTPSAGDKARGKPKFAELSPLTQRTALDETDEVAALESVQFALTEVGDGASYIWHRNNGRLSGMVQPVTSFKDPQGQVCRHVLVVLTAGTHSKKAEGVACRLPGGQWKLEG
jgi:surface antigen